MNNFEKSIQEKMQGREIQPSASAWERLSSQLDAQEQKKKRGWFFYIGYAASILLLVSLFFFMNKQGGNETAIPENTIVKDDFKIPETNETKGTELLPSETDVIVENRDDKLPVKSKLVVEPFKEVKTDSRIALKKENKNKVDNALKKTVIIPLKNEIIIAENNADVDKPFKTTPKFKKVLNSTISVDSDALLYAVTHNKQEIKSYYEKYKISRLDVLKTIEKELKRSNLKIDPNTILAEVERDVKEESFQNNFLRFIKKRVSDVAVAIANRNN
tara:strand:+ start:66129 stop:66950 length:822 start_codon:yes stop_codon:yes gene_type:complete